MSRTSKLSPWARSGLAAAGVDLFTLNARLIDSWYIGGNAETSRGPWHYTLHRGAEAYEAVCQFVTEIPLAIEGLFEQAGLASTLEEQLAASLEAIR